MNTLQALIITLGIIAIGLIILHNVIQLTQIVTRKTISIRSLFFNFKQKMWMTAGLGFTFFILFILIVFLSSNLLDERLNFFIKVYQNPTAYVYIGLSFFISISISIYLVRMFIIYLFQSKKR